MRLTLGVDSGNQSALSFYLALGYAQFKQAPGRTPEEFVIYLAKTLGGPAMLIRAAVPSDAEEIFAVHISAIREVCGVVYDAAQIEAWTCRKRPEGYLEPIAHHPFFVAVVDERVVGFSELNPETGEVCAVYVRPDRVRQGIGHQLLETVEGAARDRSLSRLQLSATLNAVPFYEAHGYVLDGAGSVLLGDGTNLPCMNMHKELDS